MAYVLQAFPGCNVCPSPRLTCPLLCPPEPSRSPLQGPQTREETQSHGGPEEQAAESRRGSVYRKRQGPRAGQREDRRC